MLAPAVDGQSPPPVSSPDKCLGHGATFNFYTTGWNPPSAIFVGWRNYVTVLGNGTTPIGTIPITSTGGEFPSYRAIGSVTLPANAGGLQSWTVRQTNFQLLLPGQTGVPPLNQGPFYLSDYASTRWTCNPTLTANTTCLPPSGGSLTLTGLVNRSNDRVDVGFDVDITKSTQPISNIIRNVGNTGPNGEINITFTTPPLAPGNHTFYSGNGGFDGPFYWQADDQATNRDYSDVIVPAPVTVPCPSAALLITPGAVDFGSANVGSVSGPAALNVVNAGTLAAPISSITISTGDFVMENNGCDGITLAPNASCAVTVHFAPGSAGPKAATFTATSSNTATASASLTGTGALPPGLTISPTSKNFGSVAERGSSPPSVFTVTNTGSAPQAITSVELTGAQSGDFALDPDTCGSAVVAGGGTCTVKVAFQPAGAGARTAKLVVKSDANLSVTATLRGTGQAGRLGFDPNPADFGVVAVGSTSVPISLKVTNGGAAPLTISAVHIGGPNAAEFLVAADSCTGQVVAPATSCTVDVLFRPSDAGDRTATLDFDDEDGTASDALHGVGIFQAILKFTPPVVSAGSLATVVGQAFPPNTSITLQWQESGMHVPIKVTSDAAGAFRASFVIIVGERLGPRHLEPAADPGVLDEPRPVAALLVQAPTFRPQGVAIRSGGFSPTLVSRG